ncbi:putative quinol monooxygenase [Ciceribacter selenitireducens]|uniref:putative quinol monooxygenase n=1 Tax=Ciceribacter selenitireducens TaxID=448181 RepID=UPI0004B72BB7|nr:antibiotic biosynthesis monooxygenase [Ciceribacter selenitireducens]
MTDRPSSPARLRRIVRLTMAEGRGGEARLALLELRKATLPEPGCAEFEFFQSLADERAFVLIEDFADEAALARHMEEPHTRAFFGLNLLQSAEPVAKEWLA